MVKKLSNFPSFFRGHFLVLHCSFLHNLLALLSSAYYKVNFIEKVKVCSFTINPLTPKSDQHLISPYNITLESHIKVMRIKEMINN